MRRNSYINPELVKSFRISLAPRRAIMMALLSASVALVIAGVSWATYADSRQMSLEARIDSAATMAFDGYFVVLVALMFVMAPALTALSFIQEKLRGTAIFQQMVLLSPFDAAVGKFVGSTLAVYFIALIFSPFFILSAALSDARQSALANYCVLIFFGGLFCQSVGLLLSAALSSSNDKLARGGLLIGPLAGALGIIVFVLAQSSFVEWNRYSRYTSWHFFGADVPARLAITSLFVFGTISAFLLSVRQIKSSQLIRLQQWPLWLFFLVAEAILVGLFWGRLGGSVEYTYDLFQPIAKLVCYALINWVGLLILAGGSAVGSDRVRELWSATRDAHVIFNRSEIKKIALTFLIVTGISFSGLIALWQSYHATVNGVLPNISQSVVMVSVALCFVATVIGMAAFVQYCAMSKLRMGGWAGVALAVALYAVLAVAGSLTGSSKGVISLLNPLQFMDAVTEQDEYLQRAPREKRLPVRNDLDITRGEGIQEADPNVTLIKGVMGESLLAMMFVGLTFLRWNKVKDEMIAGAES